MSTTVISPLLAGGSDSANRPSAKRWIESGGRQPTARGLDVLPLGVGRTRHRAGRPWGTSLAMLVGEADDLP
jgi:hypothetical protein